MKWLWLLLLASVALAGDGARLYYSRTFPGSAPPYFDITLESNGDVVYREAVDDDFPTKFRLSDSETAQVFGLADKLDHFKHPLESPLKVAFMGTKIFRYELGAEKDEVKFNYTEDLNGQALLDWFERMADSAQQRDNLERAAKYDHLGVMHAVELLAGAYERKRMVGLDQFLPILDRISKNENYMHQARALAAEIAESIRKGGP
ncbi:MAG TPA: hypothetical protein VHW09_02595 [Bryobacteraceae bacterium]|jgi:hypothetical protein|nr:hypothetical protein [Bryobacteraceae bacterium]